MLHKTFLLLLLASSFLFTGCSQTPPATSSGDGKTVSASLPIASDAAKNAPQSSSLSSGKEVMHLTVYQAAKDGLHLTPEIHSVAKNDAPAQTALELLTAAPKNPNLVQVMPLGVKVKSLTIRNHIAYADFNAKLIENNPGGSTQELLLVAAIVNTLTEFPSIEQVQILVDNQIRATLGGHVDISEPLSRSEAMIKK